MPSRPKIKEEIEVNYVGYDHEEAQRCILYAGEKDEYAARFNLTDILEVELDMFLLPNGMTESEGKPRFDALRFELVDMIRKIDAIRYG